MINENTVGIWLWFIWLNAWSIIFSIIIVNCYLVALKKGAYPENLHILYCHNYWSSTCVFWCVVVFLSILNMFGFCLECLEYYIFLVSLILVSAFFPIEICILELLNIILQHSDVSFKGLSKSLQATSDAQSSDSNQYTGLYWQSKLCYQPL